MVSNLGKQKETEMVNELNEKKYEELTDNCKNFIEGIFGKVKDDDLILCRQIDGYTKPDFFVKIDDYIHYVSMKSGSATQVDEENIKDFIIFLRSIGISNHTLATILYFQYGDGTKDGTGKERIEHDKLNVILGKRIKDANKELNSNPKIVEKVITRCLFQGNNDDYIPAEYIYHGDKNYGVIVSKKQIFAHLKKRSWKWVDNLHIGPLLIRPHARYYKKEIKNESYRHKVEIYWPRLPFDLDYISKTYN